MFELIIYFAGVFASILMLKEIKDTDPAYYFTALLSWFTVIYLVVRFEFLKDHTETTFNADVVHYHGVPLLEIKATNNRFKPIGAKPLREKVPKYKFDDLETKSVTFEMARKLNDIGIKIPSLIAYVDIGDGKHSVEYAIDFIESFFYHYENITDAGKNGYSVYLAPTREDLMVYLNNVYGVDILLRTTIYDTYIYTIYIKGIKQYKSKHDYSSRETALDIAFNVVVYNLLPDNLS